MNTITISGKLKNEVDLRQVPNGDYVASFTVLVPREQYTVQQNKYDEIKCIVWKDRAIWCNKNLKEGSMVYIEGMMRTGKRTLKNLCVVDANTQEQKNLLSIPTYEVYVNSIRMINH